MCYSFVTAHRHPFHPTLPSLFCADVIVFFGTTPASSAVVLCVFRSLNARLTRRPDPEGWHRVPVEPRETISSSHHNPYHGPVMALPARNPTNACLQPVMLPLPLNYQMCIHVWVQSTCSCVRCVCERGCVRRPWTFVCVGTKRLQSLCSTCLRSRIYRDVTLKYDSVMLNVFFRRSNIWRDRMMEGRISGLNTKSTGFKLSLLDSCHCTALLLTRENRNSSLLTS